MSNLNLITTECGQQFIIDYLDQVALGIIDSKEYVPNSLFIPPTYSLYKTVNQDYLLEITHFNTKNHSLETTYRLLPETEATTYLENGNLNVLMH
ncbi:hypothetical protein [Adhaeribacter aquaticus]|uniref:hypothetical protein n=1 Tax=Adhaeribacter aquaticus TaxID=299567 RepID=UPI0004130856|nr:hypothetical protein [Adhaeribacter aquaticus]